MAMRDYFKGAVSAVAGAGMLAGAAFAPDTASAQDQQMAANDTARPQAASLKAGLQSRDVFLRVGPGFSLSAADGVAGYVERESKGRCRAIVTTEKGFPMRLTLDVPGEDIFRFKEDEIGSAAASALSSCRGPA